MKNQITTKTTLITTCAILLALLCTITHAQQEVEFNYSGRVRVDNNAFNGDGQFKFALVSQNGQTSYWSNDSTSVSGSEPTTHVILSVHRRLLQRRHRRHPHRHGPTRTNRLQRRRTHLPPRLVQRRPKRLPTPQPRPPRSQSRSLLGQQSFDQDITLYVDAINGDDSNTGLTTGTAKQTIQAAWDSIPKIVRSNFNVVVFPGSYREESTFSGKVMVGSHTVSIAGSTTDSTQVVISGDMSPLPAAENLFLGFIIKNQNNIVIENITFEKFQNAAIFVSDNSQFTINNCVIDQCWDGILIIRSEMLATKLTVKDGRLATVPSSHDPRLPFFPGGNDAIRADFLSSITIEESTITNHNRAISVFKNSNCKTVHSNIDNCGWGFFAIFNAFLTFGDPPEANTIQNCDKGVVLMMNSTAYGPGHQMYSGNTDDNDFQSGSQVFNP